MAKSIFVKSLVAGSCPSSKDKCRVDMINATKETYHLLMPILTNSYHRTAPFSFAQYDIILYRSLKKLNT